MARRTLPPRDPDSPYPDSDDQPIAESTWQFDWIAKIHAGLTGLFRDRPDVFVAADLFWYPVEGHPEIRTAPDAMVAFGRPSGDRWNYLQWEEGGVAPQVVFEVLPPRRRLAELYEKFSFYQQFGVEEFYVYDPHPPCLEWAGYIRRDGRLVEVTPAGDYVSPRLQVCFEMRAEGLRIIRPDGQPFLSYEELGQRIEELERARLDEERRRADEAVSEVERLREKLRALGQKPG